jgi:hypothetical protein
LPFDNFLSFFLKKDTSMLRLLSLFVVLMSSLPIHAEPPPYGQVLFNFLAGKDEVIGGGGGVVIRRADVIRCRESKASAPGGPETAVYDCQNSAKDSLIGDTAKYAYGLIRADPSSDRRALGGQVNLKIGTLACDLESIAAPGGPVEKTYDCN